MSTVTTATRSPLTPAGRFTLLLLDLLDGKVRCAFGPYATEQQAAAARDELNEWPLEDGTWLIVKMKWFQAQSVAAADLLKTFKDRPRPDTGKVVRGG